MHLRTNWASCTFQISERNRSIPWLFMSWPRTSIGQQPPWYCPYGLIMRPRLFNHTKQGSFWVWAQSMRGGVMPPLIGWTHTQNDPCPCWIYMAIIKATDSHYSTISCVCSMGRLMKSLIFTGKRWPEVLWIMHTISPPAGNKNIYHKKLDPVLSSNGLPWRWHAMATLFA